MDPVLFAWWCSLVVTLVALPLGIIRLLALRAGGAVPHRAVRVSGWLAIGLGLIGLVCYVALTVLVIATDRM